MRGAPLCGWFAGEVSCRLLAWFTLPQHTHTHTHPTYMHTHIPCTYTTYTHMHPQTHTTYIHPPQMHASTCLHTCTHIHTHTHAAYEQGMPHPHPSKEMSWSPVHMAAGSLDQAPPMQPQLPSQGCPLPTSPDGARTRCLNGLRLGFLNKMRV